MFFSLIFILFKDLKSNREMIRFFKCIYKFLFFEINKFFLIGKKNYSNLYFF